MKKEKMTLTAAAVAAVLGAASFNATAQAYPSKPIKVVIPWPGAGSNDMVARLVMSKVGQQLNQKIDFENRPGASGVVGTELFAKMPPDGYNLMVHSATHMANGHIYKKLSYDTMAIPGVALLAAQPGVLSIHPSLPVKSAKEFIALAKSKPGEIAYSSSGQGSAPHMSMAFFASMAKINLKHQAYRGGIPGVDALAVGEVQASIATIATVFHHLKSNKIKPIGVTSMTRASALPEIPTISESGLPGYEVSPWIGLFAPAGTPAAVLQRINAEVNTALKDSKISAELKSQSLDPIGGTLEQFTQRLRADYTKYGNLVKLTGADQVATK